VIKEQRRFDFNVTPEKTQAWSLALYPAVVLGLVVFMILSGRQVTTDVIGLFIGLIAAGSLKAVVQKKGGERVNSSDISDSSRGIHPPGSQELE